MAEQSLSDIAQNEPVKAAVGKSRKLASRK